MLAYLGLYLGLQYAWGHILAQRVTNDHNLIGRQPQFLEGVELVCRGVAEDGDVLDGVATQVQADQTPQLQNPGIDLLQVDG